MMIKNNTYYGLLKLCAQSWHDINYKYEGLTPVEKECISEDSFNDIVEILKNKDWIKIKENEN